MNSEQATLVFIVNGEDTEVATNPSQTLRNARNRALLESGNIGRPSEDWEIRTPAGSLLSADAKIASFKFDQGHRLVLCLRASDGG